MSSSTAYNHARTQIISGYRRLYRARKLLFSEDEYAMKQSRTIVKEQFLHPSSSSFNNTATTNAAASSTTTDTTSPQQQQQQQQQQQLKEYLSLIDDAVHMLTTSVVQGKLNPNTGNYQVKLKKEHFDETSTVTVCHTNSSTGSTSTSTSTSSGPAMNNNNNILVEQTINKVNNNNNNNNNK